MHQARRFALSLALFAVALFLVPPSALADRIGEPYRGPEELLSGAGTDTGGGGGGGDGGGDGGGGPPERAKGRLDPNILWSWYWELNKERWLARATAPGRVVADGSYYWFGGGAKYPPREIGALSAKLRRTVFNVLEIRLDPKQERRLGVRAEAAIAMGRLGNVPAAAKERDRKKPDNLVVRALVDVLRRERGVSPSGREIRTSALLGLGITGDPDACQFLMREWPSLPLNQRGHAALAFGLARHIPAIDLLIENLPLSNREMAPDERLACVVALGLYGPENAAEVAKDPRFGIKRLTKLASNPRGNEPVVMQSLLALARLQQGRPVVDKAFHRSRSNAIQWASLLALAYYAGAERDAAAAAQTLIKAAGKGKGQQKCFATLALGDLAERLNPNSPTRSTILRHLRSKEGVRTTDNYVRACAALALGVAGSRTTIHDVAQLLTNTTVDDYVIGAACVALGLLRSTDHTPVIMERVLHKKRWKNDARGYGVLGLAMIGDTSRLDEVLAFTRGNVPIQTERQVSLALGVLGDRRNAGRLLEYFSKDWKTNRRFTTSQAVFGVSWMRDAGAIEKLVALATSRNSGVRAMAVTALGYTAAAKRVCPISRIYENQMYRSKFAGWDFLRRLSLIL